MKRRCRAAIASALGLALGAVVLAGTAGGAPATHEITLISQSIDADGADSGSTSPSVSADGRYVAFHSFASDLVASDPNGGTQDIFLRDTQTGTTTLISQSIDADGADSGSTSPSVSADGRYVAFHSFASDLVASDPNGGTQDIFLRDTQTGTTTLISQSIDADGADSGSTSPSVSADGRYVAFHSFASDLVASDPNGGTQDIFLRDTQTGTTTLISQSIDADGADSGSTSPSVSADGRYVAFHSFASDLVASDPNGGTQDIFLRDTQTGTTTLISQSIDADGADSGSTSPSVSADGRYVAFHSFASDLVASDPNGGTQDIFLRDTQTGTTTLISQSIDADGADSGSTSPSVSADGRYVAFHSFASDLVASDPNGGTQDIFLRDTQTGTTTLISQSIDADGADSGSTSPSVSADGRYVAFHSFASDLVASDPNGITQDIFLLHDLGASPTLALPAAISKVAAPGANSATVTYSVSASDTEDGALTPSCSPASGTSFPVGTTTITCTVTDSDSNTAHGSFRVTVTATAAPAPSPVAPKRTSKPVFQMRGPATARVGNIAGYKFIVRNRGTAFARNARLRVTLPPRLALFSSQGKKTSNRRFSRRGRILTWNLGTIRPGRAKVVVLRTRPTRRGSKRVTVRSQVWATGVKRITRTHTTRVR